MTKKPAVFAEFYKKFRSGKVFFLTLSLFIAGWIAAHILFGFDSDWGLLNLILSMEASLSMSLFMMLSEQQDAFERSQNANNQLVLKTILDVAEVTRDQLILMQKAEDDRQNKRGAS